MQKRILVITPFFYPHPGGSQQYIEELYSQLMEINPEIKVDVLTYNIDKRLAKEEYRGMTIYRVGCVQVLPGQWAIPNYFEVWRTIKKIKEEWSHCSIVPLLKPLPPPTHKASEGHSNPLSRSGRGQALKEKGYLDPGEGTTTRLVNAHTRFFESSWWAPKVAQYLEAKSVLTDHCAYHPQHPSIFVRAVARIIDNRIIPWLGNKYDYVTAVSQATADFLNKNGLKKEIKVIHGGVDTEKFRPSSRQERIFPRLNKEFSAEESVVSFVGRMIPAKGPEIALEAVKSLKKQGIPVQLVMAGDGPVFEKLKPQVQVLAREGIYVLGRVTQEEVAEILAKSDMLVLPSTHHEGLPIVLLEAGASDCAVITTDRGGVREVITDGENGLITKPKVSEVEASIMKLIEDKRLRLQLGANLRAKIEKEFTWKRIAKEYNEWLKVNC